VAGLLVQVWWQRLLSNNNKWDRKSSLGVEVLCAHKFSLSGSPDFWPLLVPSP
jgi:hypothetical protein